MEQTSNDENRIKEQLDGRLTPREIEVVEQISSRQKQ